MVKTEIMTFRPKQFEATTWLLDRMQKGQHKVVGLSGQPGFGKSFVQQVMATKLVTEGTARVTVTLAPQILIEGTLLPDKDTVCLTPDGDTFIHLNPFDWKKLRDNNAGKKYLLSTLAKPNPHPTHMVTTYQALLKWFQDSPGDLPSLENTVWFLDEAHHVSEGNQFGQVIQALQERGATCCFISATLYRHTGKTLIDLSEAPTFIVPISEAMKGDTDGSRYCPEHLDLRTSHVEHSKKDLFPHPRDYRWDHVYNLWEKDDYPKMVVILEAGESEIDAENLRKFILNKRPEARILIAIGGDVQTKKDVDVVLARERDLKKYKDSHVDIILACKRFDEGVDWPLCSHVLSLNPTNSIGLMIQRIGRALRPKTKYKGYPKRFANLAVFETVFDVDIENPDWVHLDRTFMVSAMMADCRVTHDYLKDAFKKEWEQNRKRTGRENPEAWTTFDQMMNCTVEESKQVLGDIASIQATLVNDGFKKTDFTNDRILKRMERGSYDERTQALIKRFLALRTIPRVAKQYLSNRLREIIGKKSTDERWVHEAMQKFFEDVVESHRDHVTLDLVSEGFEHLTRMTGRTAESIADDLVSRLSWEKMYDKVLAYHERQGHAKIPPSDPKEGYLADWIDKQRDAHRRNELPEHRRDLLLKLDIDMVRPYSLDDQIAELIRRCQQDPQWIPCQWDTVYGLGQVARDLRAFGTEARRQKVSEAVPWFEWDNDCAEFRRRLLDYGDGILVPESEAYLWYEPRHVDYHLGDLDHRFVPFMEGHRVLDERFHEVHLRVFQQRTEQLALMEKFAERAFNNIWGGRKFLERLCADKLLPFERDVVFEAEAFKLTLRVLTKDYVTRIEQSLHSKAREEDLHPSSVVGLWWCTLGDERKDMYRGRHFDE